MKEKRNLFIWLEIESFKVFVNGLFLRKKETGEWTNDSVVVWIEIFSRVTEKGDSCGLFGPDGFVWLI